MKLPASEELEAITPDDARELLAKLPEDAGKCLMIILRPLEKYMKESEDLFTKYAVGKPGKTEEHRSFRNRLKRIDLRIDGKRELNKLPDTLKSCNDALLTVAPPPPVYSVSWERPRCRNFTIS